MGASAQGSFAQPLIFGIKTGISGSFFTKDVNEFDPSSDFKNPVFQRFFRPTGQFGVTVDYMLKERVSLGAEILYVGRGTGYRRKNNNVLIIGGNGSQDAYDYFRYKIDYIELPFTINYNVLDPSSDDWLTGYGGLAPAIAVSKGVSLTNAQPNAGPWKGQPNQSAELTGVRTFNASAVAGIQYGSVPAFLGYYVDIRATYALLPVFTADQDVNGDNLNTRMLALTFGIGLKF